MSTRPAVIVGGGLAGLAAATVLAERGIETVVIEREAYLGGRAGSWTDTLADGTTFQMERGFHAFFRQYYNLRALLRRVDPELSTLMPLEDYPLLGPDGQRESFSHLPTRVPFNVIELVRRTPTMRWRDLLSIDARSITAMLSFDPASTYARWDGVTAKDYLDSLGFPPRARQMLFEVFAHSFFNPEEDYSAAELLAMFHYYFLGNPEGLIFDVMRAPFGTAFIEPLTRYLEARGVTIARSTQVEAVDGTPGALRVTTDRGRYDASDVVLALSVPGLRDVASRSSFSKPLADSIAALDVTHPFIVWRLFLDRSVAADRAPFAGTTGIGLLDNISVYERLEDESAALAARRGGSIVELHAYGVDPSLDDDAIRRDLLQGLHTAYPETREARIVEDRYLRRQDCPSFRPGTHRSRPGPITSMPGIYLAGDFVRVPFPSALMERAVTSGFLAANAIVDGRRLPAEPIRVPPTRGPLAPLAL